ncbi:MAG: hypothetical protein NC432_07475 [Roseburia sp.]|nr:hypothetical protein [Roseburia sp.]MCM1098559.1 hypothetical protein [Ruminococcus flavefaciens]
MQIGVNGSLAGRNEQRVSGQKREESAAGMWIASLAAAEKAREAAAKQETAEGKTGMKNLQSAAESEEEKETGGRSEAAKIFEAAATGKENPLKNMRQQGKVPYAYLAKDGIIEYNGVVFVCDEKTNSICLGDMTDPKEVITVALTGGGHLKVNRSNIGDLSKAAGMFSPEDLNRILRAIAQDTKIQSMEKEIEDLESEVGGNMSAENAAETEEEQKEAE